MSRISAVSRVRGVRTAWRWSNNKGDIEMNKYKKHIAAATLIAALALIAGMLWRGGVSAQVKRVDDPAKYEVVKVLPKLNKMTLREGVNHVETTPSGERIAVKVKGGKIVSWVVTDGAGKAISTTLERSRGNKVRCWHCYERNGEIHCFEIPCPF
jgi:hypothetical protein